MGKKIILTLLAVILICAALPPVTSMAAAQMIVDDRADLLTQEEENELAARYSGISEYMGSAFVSTDSPSRSTSSFAEEYAIKYFGNSPAVIFLIDMYNRNIYVYANGDALKTISRADSRAITDNIYKLASQGEYFECADKAFSQILAKCQGQRLARPVKHVTNALIAVLVGILLNYFMTAFSRRPVVERRTRGEIAVSVSREMANMPGIALAAPIFLSSVKHYKSKSSSGGGGGGGHSGGGGGHSF